MLSNVLTRVVQLFAIAVVSSIGLQAGPVAYRSIPDLVAGADVIFVGQLISLEASTQTSPGRVVVIPDEILKGSGSNGPVVLSYQGMNMGRSKEAIGKRVLIFVTKNAGTNDFALFPFVDGAGTSVDEQWLVTFPNIDPALQKRASDSALQKVIKEFFNAQLNSTSKNVLPLLLPLAWSRIEPDLTANGFRILRASTTPAGMIGGASGLVAFGDIEGLESLESPQLQISPELPHLISDVERFYRSPSNRGVEILSSWLNPDQPKSKRHAAAGALAQIHTAAAVMSLGPTLSDADFDVRWRAIGGLSLFANNVPIRGVAPAPGDWQFRSPDTARFSVFDRDLVRKDEQRYLNFWRNWWAENRGTINKLASENRDVEPVRQ